VKPWVVYSLIRVGVFAAVFAVLYLLAELEWWLAAIIAAAVGLCVSYLFFRPQRDELVRSITTRPESPRTDESAED
jgi:membrane protein implicated in regulation of membrane protease activity